MPKYFTFQITLDEETVQIESASWRGIDHIGVRQLFRGPDGDLYFGKNGYNCPIEEVPHLIAALIHAYNEATENAFQLRLETVDLEQLDDAIAIAERVAQERNAAGERVYTWKSPWKK